jgi:hypothetical protein
MFLLRVFVQTRREEEIRNVFRVVISAHEFYLIDDVGRVDAVALGGIRLREEARGLSGSRGVA